MKIAVLSTLLLLSLPAFATIAQIQSNASWTCAGTTCNVSFTSNPSTHNLIVVWAFWQSSSSFTAIVHDSPGLNNNFVGAVGPTMQSASNTTGQIFYAANILGNSPDTVTVTFSGSVTSAGAVIVEYSGADQGNPLDSVSAGYSTAGNTTNLLDSGNVAPANSNLLVFGAGIADANPSGGLIAGSGFSSIQAQHNGTIGSAITEQNTSAISGNNALQRATACIAGVSACSGTGNWLMQMAVFRDASWTVAGAWSPARPAGVRYADQFPGTTADAKITNAMADLPASGGIVDATALQRSQSISNTVSVTHGVTVLIGAATLSATVCPAFKFTGEGSVLKGLQMGTGTGANSPSIIQAATGCGTSGTPEPLIEFSIGAGPRGGLLRDIKLDGNNLTTVTTGVLLDLHQNLMNEVDHVTVVNVPSCVKLGGDVQNFRITRMNCDNSQFTGTEVAGLDFGAAGNNRFITVDGQSRFSCKSRCFVVGTDDHTPGNTSQVIDFIDDDFEVVTSSAQANGTIGLVRNVIGFKMLSGWVETESGANSTTMIQLGTSNSSPYPYSPRIEQVAFNSNGIATWGVDLFSTVKPVIRDNSCLSGMNTRLVKNTSGASAGIVEGNQNCSGAGGKDIDSFNEIVDYDGDSTLANDYKVFHNGWSFGGTTPVIGFQGTGNLVVTNMGSTISSPVLVGAVTALNARLALSDMGQCTMASGTCPAQSLASTYASAPRCLTQYVSGTLTGLVTASSTTTTVTPQSTVNTDNAVVSWFCFGN